MITCARAGGCAGSRYPFLTLKERDIETGLDYFLARYYSSTQGRFTSIDPYNPILDSEDATDFVTYLSEPQNWNRYGYAFNNPLKFIDPTGEAIELTGSEDERKRQLDALKQAVGKKAGAYLYENKIEVKDSAGNVVSTNYFVGVYTNGPDGKGPAFESINDVAGEIAPIIADTQVVKLDVVPEGFVTPGGNTLSATGTAPGATAIAAFSPTTMTIYLPIPPTAAGGTGTWVAPVAASKMENNKPGKRRWRTVIAHELGHARAKMTGDPDSNGAALRLDNKVRKLYNPKAPKRTGH